MYQKDERSKGSERRNKRIEARMDKSNRQKEKKAIFGVYDRMYSSLEEIAGQWDKKTVPLNLLKIAINSSKANEKTGNKYQDEVGRNNNKCLDSLYILLAKIASNMDSKSIPLSEITKGINLIKKAYN